MLEPELLLTAYYRGIFPMAHEGGEIKWYSPDPRGVIPLDDRFHVPHGLERTLKKGKFEVAFDTAFQEVMRECGKRSEGTWISEEIVESYCELHRLGHAHSVEVRLGGTLVGGLYGVHIRGAFFGESMFHRKTDASKVALVSLVKRLRANGFRLLDTQWLTDHLAQFGTYEVTRQTYLRLLAQAMKVECVF